jgi:hypothetical protein
MQKSLKRSKVETSENSSPIPKQKTSKKIRQNLNHPNNDQSQTPTIPILRDAYDQSQTPIFQANSPKNFPIEISESNTQDYITKSMGTQKGLPLYINELICYPKGELRAFIVNFRQLLYENLLGEASEPRTIVSAFMTTFGFESK